MALGKKCGSLKSKHGFVSNRDGLELGFVSYNRGLGRKRILITNDVKTTSSSHSEIKTPLKRRCSEKIVDLNFDESSCLEGLPQDILIRILYGVNHEDLKQLFHVSKLIREATLIAKKCHFAYSTPTKTRVFRSSIDFEGPNEDDEMEAPNAPRQIRGYKSRVSGKKLSDISVALFASPRKDLFMEE